MHDQDDDATIIGGLALNLTHTIQVDNESKYLVTKELSLGRSEACDIQIEDKKVSRIHAKFELLDDKLTIIDLNSSNGTFVNGKRINEKTLLTNNDIISIDSHKLKVIIDAELPKQTNSSKQPQESTITQEKQATPKEAVAVREVKKQYDEEIPTSWVEETGSIDGTKMMDPKQIDALKSKVTRTLTTADPSVTRLHCFAENSVEQVFELPVSNFEEASGWEIGRDPNCDIVIEHSSISNRHAQIIHQTGRWKIVNLVSTNGIVINGQKKLSAYLGDGDKIGLGSVDLVFKTPKNNKPKLSQKSNETAKNIVAPLVVGLVLLGLATAIYFLIF